MDLKGKKINFLGDSITEGCCATKPELGFVELIGRTCQLEAARNYGIGGTRIARQKKPSAEAKYDLDFCLRAKDMDHDADIIFVFGGTNDHGHGDAPIGSDSDRTPDTFIGACHYLFCTLKEQFPDRTIVIATPLHRSDENTPKGNSGWTLHDYVNVIRHTSAEYNLPLLDLFDSSVIQAHIPEVASKLTTDGLHPNDAGHALLAREIISFLESL